MTLRTLIALIVALALAAALTAAPVAAQPQTSGPVRVALEFQKLVQGRVGLARISGAEIVEARAVFQDRVLQFYPENGAWVGLISADIDYLAGDYTLQIYVKYADGAAELIQQPVRVEDGAYGRADVTLSAALMPLMEPAIEEAEMAQLFNIFTRVTPERYWQERGFVVPSEGEEIAWFGTWRLYNETYWRRHTGIDMRMPIGTPVSAMGDGRVVLSEELAIRGGYVLIDHGWGVYSGYAHLSQRLVVPGQWVRQGDVIGLSGLNGRSAGAHLHYEMSVSGAWVDPEQVLALGLGTR